MRGKPQSATDSGSFAGITPAYAGKTDLFAGCVNRLEDHPRVCGENLNRLVSNAAGFGSPPRMRGKLVGSVFNDGVYRITPAYAGKTGTTTMMTKPPRDHPRVCGENFPVLMLFVTRAGSPPRMRGKRCVDDRIMCALEITPADAGKTLVALSDVTSLQDHPRGCGENATPHTRISAKIGSPPRMRGKLLAAVATPKVNGITPAGAGKTIGHELTIDEIQDHPRRCGENRHQFPALRECHGSPPQVRGKQRDYTILHSLYRITPAGAGKTQVPHRL